MGKVKTEQVKRLGKELMNRYSNRFSTNFDDNKHAVGELTEGITVRIRNQVAGYITRTKALAQASASAPEEIEEEEAEA